MSNNAVIFSPTEGFWNDDDGWGFCPSEATCYDDKFIGDNVAFIGIDDAIYVNASKYKHLDYEDSRKTLFQSFSQYSGEQIAAIYKTLNDDEVAYQGDSIWLYNDRLVDDDQMEEILCDIMDISDKVMLDMLNTHVEGQFYSNKDGGFYWHIKD